MRICSIASGSSGNCIYIGDEDTHILIDAGISRKAIEAGLKGLDIEGKDLDGIFITHEHSDHVQGLWTFGKKYHVPVYATEHTLDAYFNAKRPRELFLGEIFRVIYDRELVFGDMRVYPFRVAHDAICPVGYTFRGEMGKIGIATDLGCFTGYTKDALKDCGILYLESNHRCV